MTPFRHAAWLLLALTAIELLLIGAMLAVHFSRTREMVEDVLMITR
jgi:hypothetical protein